MRRVAREPRGLAALRLVLVDCGAQRGDDMRRRREAPLPGLLQILPLVEEVERERLAVAPGLLESGPAGDHEAHARHSLEALPGSGDERLEAQTAGVDRNGPIRAHGVDDQAAAPGGDHLRDGGQRIQDPGPGFAVHLRHVRDRGIRGESRIDPGRVRRCAFVVREDHHLPAEAVHDAHDALAVAAVVRHQNLALARHQRSERRFDRERSAALQGNANVRVLRLDDRGQVATDRRCHCVECAVPRSPVVHHGGLGGLGSRQGSGRQQDRVGHGIVGLLIVCANRPLRPEIGHPGIISRIAVMGRAGSVNSHSKAMSMPGSDTPARRRTRANLRFPPTDQGLRGDGAAPPCDAARILCHAPGIHYFAT